MAINDQINCVFHQVDDKKTIGPEAFARIAPACPVVADVIIVHNLFDALTSSSSHRLHFLIYDKYLRNLDKYEILIDFVDSLISSSYIVENNVSIKCKFNRAVHIQIL